MASRRDGPFRYPKYRHSRWLKPPQYTQYQTYKRWLRFEFEQKCIYCRRPDSVHPHDYKTYAVEHYRPKEHFPERACNYDNLFYACSMCNSYKADYWPQDENEPFFPNPCDYVMMEHVRFVNFKVSADSTHGAFMVETLQLNDEALVNWRKAHVRIIRTLETEVADLKRLKKKLRNKVAQSAGAFDADNDRVDIDAKIQQHLATLDCYCGTTLKDCDTPGI
jgi:hypothetical protein